MNPRAKRQKISDRVNVLIGVAKQPQGTMQDKSQPSFSRAHSPSQKQARRVRSKDRAGDGRLAGGSRWESHWSTESIPERFNALMPYPFRHPKASLTSPPESAVGKKRLDTEDTVFRAPNHDLTNFERVCPIQFLACGFFTPPPIGFVLLRKRVEPWARARGP